MKVYLFSLFFVGISYLIIFYILIKKWKEFKKMYGLNDVKVADFVAFAELYFSEGSKNIFNVDFIDNYKFKFEINKRMVVEDIFIIFILPLMLMFIRQISDLFTQ